MSGVDLCISVRSVSKKFSRSLKRSFGYGAIDLARTLVGLPEQDRLRESEFWAVREVSFDLARGRSMGIVGLNGSGKTTLLRMVSGILQPTLGEVSVSGRIAPMLALGAGFKPVLSGRENIFLNLALLGVRERDIRQRFDSILDFAGIHEAIDAPLGTYSSGMRSRLGFACAVHTDPAILIVDEVLSVGDAQFRVKCRNRINELRRAGTSMLLVSHSALLIETLTDECIFMRRGKAVMQGPPRQVLKAYEDDLVKHADVKNTQRLSDAKRERATADQRFAISQVVLRAPNGDAGYWTCGGLAKLEIDFSSRVSTEEVSFNLMFFDLSQDQGDCVLFMATSRDLGWMTVQPGAGRITLEMKSLGLRPGTYRLKLSASQGGMHDMLDVQDSIRAVVREGSGAGNSLYYQPRDWQLAGARITGPMLEEPPCATLETEEEF